MELGLVIHSTSSGQVSERSGEIPKTISNQMGWLVSIEEAGRSPPCFKSYFTGAGRGPAVSPTRWGEQASQTHPLEVSKPLQFPDGRFWVKVSSLGLFTRPLIL
jgi:hypothetical protein